MRRGFCQRERARRCKVRPLYRSRNVKLRASALPDRIDQAAVETGPHTGPHFCPFDVQACRPVTFRIKRHAIVMAANGRRAVELVRKRVRRRQFPLSSIPASIRCSSAWSLASAGRAAMSPASSSSAANSDQSACSCCASSVARQSFVFGRDFSGFVYELPPIVRHAVLLAF